MYHYLKSNFLNIYEEMSDKGNPYNMDSTSFDSEKFLNKLLKVKQVNKLQSSDD